MNLAADDPEVTLVAEDLYRDLAQSGFETLYDDRVGISAGEKFNDSDLIGIPVRIVVSKKTIKEVVGGAEWVFEVKERGTGEVSAKTKAALLAR